MSKPTVSGAERFTGVIGSTEELRTLYRKPMKEVAEKKFDHLPNWIRVTIEASRFAFIATASPDGPVTVSPRGGRDGFVVVLDDRHLAIPDYPGNNLTDSLTNLVNNPQIGLILLIPGRNETIRVDGAAWLVTDPDVLDACKNAGGRKPKTAIVVEVREAFFHCPASFQRADMWNPDKHRPDAAVDYDDFIRDTLDESEWPDWARDDA